MAEKELKFRQLGTKKPQKRPERAHMYKSDSPGSGPCSALNYPCIVVACCVAVVTKCLTIKQPKKKGVYLALWFLGNSPSWWNSHGVLSGSREKWMLLPDISSFFCTPAQEMVPPTLRWASPPQLPQSRKSLSDTPDIYLCGDSKGYQIAIKINYYTVSCGKRGKGRVFQTFVFLTFSSVDSSPSQKAQWGLWSSERQISLPSIWVFFEVI